VSHFRTSRDYESYQEGVKVIFHITKFVTVCQSFFIKATALVTSCCVRGFIPCLGKRRQPEVSYGLKRYVFH